MNKKRIIYLAFFVTNTWLFAQTNKQIFSLEEALTYGKEHNRNIKNTDLNILSAQKRVWQTKAVGLPQVSAGIDYQTYLKTPFEIDNADPSNPLLFIFPKHNLTPSVTLNQLLFDGSYLVGLQSSKVFLEISKNAKEKTLGEVEKNIISAYNNALLTKESVNIMKKNINALTKNLNETTEVYKSGLTEEENVEQLQLTLSNLKSNLKNLESLNTISKGYLKILLGVNQEEEIQLTDQLEDLITKNIDLNLTQETQTITNNIDYKIANNKVESKRLEYKLEKAQLLPKVNAFVSSNYLGYSDSFSRFFTREQEWLFTTVAGVKLSVPLFSSFGGRAKREQAKIAWDIAKNDLITQKNTLLLDYKKAKSEYILAIDDYSNKQKNLALAEKIERKNTIKFKEGLASSFDLRQAQLQLYTSQQEYLQAIINVINKKAALKTLLNIK